MNGDKLPLAERMLRRARYWRQRRAEAGTAPGRAAVAWDQVRGEIRELPPEEQAAAWASLTEALDRVGCQLDTRVDTPRANPTRTGARTRARGAEPNTPHRKGGR